MGFFRMGMWAVLLAAGVAEPAAAQTRGGNSTTLRCESADFRDNYCPVETRGGVRLLRQISRAPCRQGASWGYDRHGVWVTEGCGAEFEVQIAAPSSARPPRYGEAPAHGEQVTCESREFRYRYCPVRVAREAELIQQISTSNCRFNRSWGYDRGGIWVDQGCGAVFIVR